MATYGLSLYNSGFKYGQAGASSVYYNANLTAQSANYGTVNLTWGQIVNPPTENPPTYWMIVKSYKGVVDNPYDGQIITGGPISAFATSYVDINYQTVDLEVSYSIWSYNGAKWSFCGSAYTVVVGEKNTLTTVNRWIPRAWTNPVNGVGDATGELETNDFVNTLSAMCFQYDLFKSQASILGRVNDHAYTPNAINAARLGNYSFDTEPALGDTYHRSLSAAGYLVQKYKGTPSGLTIYAGALTHLTSKVVLGTNLMLDYNDSSFEESTGRWTTTAGTLTAQLYSNATTTYGITLNPPTPWITDPLFKPRKLGFGALALNNQSATMSLPASDATNVINYATPVKGSTRYVFSGWFFNTGTPGINISIQIAWHDQYGSLISTTPTGTLMMSNSSYWQEVTSKNDAGRNGQLSPVNAVYARIILNVQASSNQSLFMDMLQIAEYQNSLEFEDARRIRLYLKGQRENLLPNPSFENGVGGWLASPNASFAQDPTVYNSGLFDGSSLGELTIQSGTGAWVSSPWFAVTPGQNYTFSGYFSSEYPNAGRCYLIIEYSNRETDSLQTQILSDSNGQYYSPTVNSYSSACTVTAASSDGTTVTYVGNNNFVSGQVVTITGLSTAAFNLSAVTVATATSTGFTVLNSATGTAVTGASGFAGVVLVSTDRLDSNGNPIVDTAVPQYTPSLLPTYNGYPIQYVPVLSRLSISAIAPDMQKDSGQPLAKVTAVFPDMTGNGMTVWMDALMFESSPSVGAYFSGSGAPAPTNPITSYFISSQDTVWETKDIINYVQNPSFESGVTTWTAATGTTLTQDAGPEVAAIRLSNPDGTYQNPPAGIVPTTYLPLYGSYMGKVSYPAVTITGITATGTAVTYKYTSTSQLFSVGQSVVIWGNAIGATPAFNNTTPTGWTASTITAVGTVTSGSSYSFTIASTATGTATTFGQAQINGASISTTIYLSSPAVGGEDFIVSADIRAAEGTYTISTSGNGLTTSNNMEVYQHDQYQWMRIWAPRQLVAGETSFTLTISIALPPQNYPTGGPGYTIATTSFFNIDGVQAEYGTTPSGFLDANNPNYVVTSMPNPGNTATTMWVGQVPSVYGGKSSWFNNYAVKLSRLTNTIGNLMPQGATWCIKPGYPTDPIPELTTSLLPAASFEVNLGTWAGTSATLARTVSRGLMFGDNVSHGSAYCTVTSTASGTYGITSQHVSVVPAQGYYASVAIRPTAASVGTYTLTVNFYDANGNLIPATTGTRTVTANITQTNRWAYLANTFSSATTINASYAIYTVTCTPTTPSVGQSFGIDRCVFRQ